MSTEEMKELADRLVLKVEIRKSQMRKCPFCGCVVGITICDDEGNDKPLDYLDDPYSGIAFKFNHDNGGCILCDFNEISPIYSVEDDVRLPQRNQLCLSDVFGIIRVFSS